MNLSKSLQDNINTLSGLLPLDKSFDIISRRLKLCHMDCFFLGINGYLDSRVLHNLFSDLQNISFASVDQLKNQSSEVIREHLMSFRRCNHPHRYQREADSGLHSNS